jgi:hypothetical protein
MSRWSLTYGTRWRFNSFPMVLGEAVALVAASQVAMRVPV